VLSACPGQVDFLAGQVSFHSHLPDGQRIRQLGFQLNKIKENNIKVNGTSKIQSCLSFGQVFFKP